MTDIIHLVSYLNILSTKTKTKSNCKNKLPPYYVCTQIHKTELKKHSEEPDVVVYVNIQVLIKLSR
jgi:hypothetical protein